MRNIQPSKANFDLEHLAGLSDAPSLLLVVSERTLYLLENLSALDVGDHRRYAVEYAAQEYQPVAESDPEFNLYKDVRDLAQLEILEVGAMGDFYGIADTDRLLASYQFPSAGFHTLTIGAVPAGEKWQVEQIMARNLNSVCTSIEHRVVKTGGFADLVRFDSPAQTQWHLWTGRVSLVEGDVIRCRFVGCAANDNVDAVAWIVKLT